jgi:hypothetical protein
VSLPAPVLALLRLLPGISLPGPAVLALALYAPSILVSAGVTLYLEFLDPRTSHGGAHIRGAVLASVTAYLLSSVLSAGPLLNLAALSRCFFPSLGSVSAVLASLYIWIFVIYLRELFRARELFESHIRHFRAEELQRVMLEDSAVMSAAEARSHSAARHYGLQLGLVFLLTLLCGFLRAPLPPFHYALSILILAGAALIFSLFGLFRQEQFFAGEGVAVSPPERGRRIGAGALFCAASAALAVFCAATGRILPLSLIAAFFAWLAGLLRRTSRPAEPWTEAPLPEAVNPGFPALPQFLEIEQAEPWPFWEYLPYIVLAVIGALFLWFMVKPLFSLRGGRAPFVIRLGRLIREGFRSLRLGLRNFFASLRGGTGARIRIPDEKVQNLAGDLLALWSGARRRELRQSLSLFARLILWGDRQYQAAWKPSMGPGEFCALLARRARLSSPQPPPGAETPGEGEAARETELPGEILRCGEIFEEALYGPRPPDRETRREFRRLVEKITGQ